MSSAAVEMNVDLPAPEHKDYSDYAKVMIQGESTFFEYLIRGPFSPDQMNFLRMANGKHIEQDRIALTLVAAIDPDRFREQFQKECGTEIKLPEKLEERTECVWAMDYDGVKRGGPVGGNFAYCCTILDTVM